MIPGMRLPSALTWLIDEASSVPGLERALATEDRFRAADKWWRIAQIQTSRAPFIINAGQAKGYWVMSVPPEIIPDHNDIFRPAAIELFAALYRICHPSVQRPPMQRL